MSSENTIPFREREPRVHATSNEVVFDGFVEHDPDVVQVFNEAEDVEQAAHTVMQIGARAIRVANTSTDTNLVEKAFDQMSAAFDQKLRANLEQVTQASDDLFRDDGQVAQTLTEFRKGLDASLDDTFDPKSKESVIAKVENVVRDLAKAQQDALRRMIDSTDDSSPLRKMQRDLAEVVKATGEGLTKQVQDLSERIAVEDKAAEVFSLTTLKGATFEDVVHSAVSSIAAPHGDAVEQCRNEAGFKGAKKGDEVITLNPDDTGGATGRVTLEIKDKKLSQSSVTSELDEAMANRGAAAAVLVFAKQEQAPTTVPFSYSGNHAIVVLDKDEPDVNSLRLAYMWSRWVVRRSLAAGNADEVDLEKVGSLFDRIATALERTKMVKRGHTQSTKGLELAGQHLLTLEQEVVDAIDELRDELGA